MKTPLQLHAQEWSDCTDCELHHKRHKVVIGKGNVPCQILFVGEAPGISENLFGRPFVEGAPSGKLLHDILRRAIPGSWCPICKQPCFLIDSGVVCRNGHGGVISEEDFVPVPTIGFTNLIGCIPLGEEGSKMGQPPHESIVACKPRLEQFLHLCQPRLIVAVGELAYKWLEQGYHHSVKLPERNTPILKIRHPSFILRQSLAEKPLLIKECVIALKEAVEDYVL